MPKEVEILTGSATKEINFTIKGSDQELGNLQFACDSYIPVTPLKPVLPRMGPTYEQRQINWFSEDGFLFSNDYAEGSQTFNVPACYKSSNPVDITNGFHNWEEILAPGSRPSEFSGSQQGHLLALANATSPKDFENTVRLRTVNGESSSFLPVYRSQFLSNRYEATSSPSKQGVSHVFNLSSNNGRVSDMNLSGNSIPTRPMYDLNYPPISSMDAFLSENIPFQFAPFTPDHPSKYENKNVVHGMNLDETAITRGKTIELQQLAKDLSSTVESTRLKENHNSDKTDLNKTPQQKPRRRKHRPKVVVEGKPVKTPKPAIPKPERPKENPIFRTYIRKNKLYEASTNAGLKTDVVEEKSCKRALNFDLEGEVREEREDFISESQAQSFYTKVESTSKVQLGEGIEIVLEKTQLGLAYDLNRSINKMVKEYISVAEIRSLNPQTPNKDNPLQKGSMANDPNDHAKGKCQIAFSDETLNKQTAPTRSTTLADDKQARGLKRGNLHDYPPMFPQNWYNGHGIPAPAMHFPMIYKKKRTKKIYGPIISNTVHSTHPTGYTSTGVASFVDFRGKELNLECGLRADQMGKMKRKRSKVPTRVRDFNSLMRIIECGPKYDATDYSPKSMEALVAETYATIKKKKRTKRLSFTPCTSTGVLKKRTSTVEEITELLGRLDINSEKNQERNLQKRELVPFNFHFEDRNALIIYQRHGTIVPFTGAVKKRKPRPKVDLDEETNRVWSLLLENINNEGIDGTDDEKAKWWDGERRVYQGRADSFIARMHLVQGDRRFSPWKGSVLDSVVGVFLTQNVSDHLSSSAFMSLAARFPLNPESSSTPFDEGTSTVSKVSQMCILDLDNAINWKGDKSNCIASEEALSTNKPPVDRGTSIKSTLNTKNDFFGIFGKGLQIDDKTISDRETLDDALSSQFSAPSKDSVDSSGSQPRSNSNYNMVPSFVELLQMAASSQGQFNKRTNVSSCKENALSLMRDTENCTSEQSGVTAESVSHIMVQNMNESTLIGQPKDKEVESSLKAINKTSSNSSKPKGKTGKQKQSTVNWDSLRVQMQDNSKKREKNDNTMDSLDWEAVRCADVSDIADTIKERGMNNVLAERIKDFLNRLVKEHGSTDLEWLRDVPPDKTKEFLLSVRGLGLKSVECVRLLTLHHLAFPVDTNVGRIAVRLGWVPLQPLPESLQLHLLELYPVLESIQRYLWPRLCKLDQRTLYELHYQMITFGKVFCTKSKPNCNACPMRGECRHFASAFTSARLSLPSPEEKNIVSSTENKTTYQNPVANIQQLQLPSPQFNQQIQPQYQSHCVPIIEVPSTPEPIVEVPASPEFEENQQIPDIEDAVCEDPDDIPTIKLNIEEFAQNLQNYIYRNIELQKGDVSKALIALTPEAASIPTPRLKNVDRLRTEHSVYELPDTHPLLEGLDKREPDDPCSYLLAIWTPGETASSISPPEGRCCAQELSELCGDTTCFSCNSIREANSQTVRGTILIPCRTAMRGSFPLNGTYFQVNEVFADHDSSLNPIDVPRSWIWNLPRRTVYFGTSIPSIFKGLSTESIQLCFWRGFVCVRGFHQKTRGPRPLMARLHFPASKLPRAQGKPTNEQK